MFNFFKRKEQLITLTIKPTEAEQLELARLCDAYRANGTMVNRVKFFQCARRIIDNWREPTSDVTFVHWKYDEKNGYIDLSSAAPEPERQPTNICM